MKISVIVPIYNMEKYLNRCIDSILNQTFFDFELVLVDDGSTDASSEICDSYKDSRFIVLHKKNEGVSVARNCGLDIASGKYVCFVDADDFLDNDYLMNFYKAIKDNDIDIVYSGLRHLPSGRERNVTFPLNIVKSGLEMIEENSKIFTGATFPFAFRCCFNRQFLLNNGIKFDSDVKYGEDSVFNLTAMLYAKHMICIGSISYNYCSDNSNSASRGYKQTMIHDFKVLYEKRKELLNSLSQKKHEYMIDMTENCLFEWLPATIRNCKNSPKGFKYKDAKILINADFIQDTAKFLIENKLYDSKKSCFYYKCIMKKRYCILFFMWKHYNYKQFIGFSR